MRSLNNFQNNNNLFNLAPERRFPPLASELMEMFDISKIDMNLLRKRQLAIDNLYQKEIQKKTKPSINDCFVPLNLPGLNPTLFSQNFLAQPQLSIKDQIFGFEQYHPSLGNIQHIQNLQNLSASLMFAQNMPSFNQVKLNNFSSKPLAEKGYPTFENIFVKEEYTVQEDTKNHIFPLSHSKADQITNEETSAEGSPDKNELQIPESLEEPALLEFTQKFTEWDLGTIFSFLKSGKPKNVFEKEKQFRMERKLRKMRNNLKKKEKLASQKQKQIKTNKPVKTVKKSQEAQEQELPNQH